MCKERMFCTLCINSLLHYVQLITLLPVSSKLNTLGFEIGPFYGKGRRHGSGVLRCTRQPLEIKWLLGIMHLILGRMIFRETKSKLCMGCNSTLESPIMDVLLFGTTIYELIVNFYSYLIFRVYYYVVHDIF